MRRLREGGLGVSTVPEFAELEEAPEAPPMSEIGRLAGVFFSPGQAFKDIAQRPRWFVPVLLGMVATTAFLYLFSERVGWELFLRQQMAANVNVSAEQRAAAMAVMSRIQPFIVWGSGLLGPIIAALIMSGVLAFLANVVMGAGVGFKNALAAVTYGTLPNLLKTGLAILVMYLKPPDEFDLQNPLMVNAAAFLPQDSPRWMITLGASFDLFTFWSMILVSIGLAAASRRMTAGKAFGMILFPWALFVILQTGAAALRGG